MTRHELREEIFRIVFSLDTRLRLDPAADTEQLARDYIIDSSEHPLRPREARLVIDKAVAVARAMPQLDEMIREKAEGWTLERMGRVELNLIRLALYEIYFDEQVPAKVAVNEAVELAKVYAGEGAPGFVNGFLKHFL